jgi:hypothetical protein
MKLILRTFDTYKQNIVEYKDTIMDLTVNDEKFDQYICIILVDLFEYIFFNNSGKNNENRLKLDIIVKIQRNSRDFNRNCVNIGHWKNLLGANSIET